MCPVDGDVVSLWWPPGKDPASLSSPTPLLPGPLLANPNQEPEDKGACSKYSSAFQGKNLLQQHGEAIWRGTWRQPATAWPLTEWPLSVRVQVGNCKEKQPYNCLLANANPDQNINYRKKWMEIPYFMSAALPTTSRTTCKLKQKLTELKKTGVLR